MSAIGTYAARNVINAPVIKAAIVARSVARQDTEEVRAWLANHFWRHAVGNFQAPVPAVLPVTDLDAAQAVCWPAPVPIWVSHALDRPAGDDAASAPLWWVDPASDALLALEHTLLEFLLSRGGTALAGKLMRINCPQALALWAAEHRAFAAKAASGWRTHQPDAVRLVWRGENGYFVELRHDSPSLRHEMAYESQMMRHCLGQFDDRRQLSGGYGEHYASACESGRMRLFSFRKDNDHPHITISVLCQSDGRLMVDQIKGKQNSPPVARYQADVRDFLDSLPTTTTTPADAAGMGLVRLPSGWANVGELRDEASQMQAVRIDPGFFPQLPDPSLTVQWLVAGMRPDIMQGLPVHPHVRAALEGIA